ncbi:MAG: DNA polymerase III subunit delta [Methylococcales bacterium]
MRLKIEQLPSALNKGLASIYVFSGDEPYQLGEGADLVRRAASQAGFIGREVFFAEPDFNWITFLQAVESESLFSERRVLDLRLSGKGPGKEGGKALLQYIQWSPEDTLLLVTLGKLAVSAQKAVWFEALDRAGVIIQVWPLEGQQLLKWLEKRMLMKGLQTDNDGLRTLANRVEGNLLAAAQEIDKLFVLLGGGKISATVIDEAVAVSSRYDVFKLADCVLKGDVRKAKTILVSLRQEGVASAVVLWALAKEVRTLEQICFQRNQGVALDEALRRCHVWDKRKPLYSHAVKRLALPQLMSLVKLSARADRLIKGIEKGDEWSVLLDICCGLVGLQLSNGSEVIGRARMR